MEKATLLGPIWFSVGEASGDLHGAELIKAFKAQDSEMTFVGMGGPAMRDQGMVTLYDMDLISLVGLTEILGGLPRILHLLRQINKALIDLRPRAIVLVDCPEFNFRVAKMAKKIGIPVYYYISPQIWAWRSGRVNFLREHVRRVICILPFEKAFYEKFGVDVDYVGHPLMDVLPFDQLEETPVQKNRIGLLPGSRSKEISTLLPLFGETARRLSKKYPDLQYVMVCAPGRKQEELARLWPEDIPIECVLPEDRYTTFRSCRFILAASGTVTLETALIGTPTLVAYKVSYLSMLVGRLLINVDYISLPNLIMNEAVFPEFVQENATSENLEAAAIQWLENDQAYSAAQNQLQSLRQMVGDPGAADRAAQIICNDLMSLE